MTLVESQAKSAKIHTKKHKQKAGPIRTGFYRYKEVAEYLVAEAGFEPATSGL